MFKNHLKETMKKRPVFGMTIYSGCPATIEALGYFGFDFAFIDAEHTSMSVTDLKECVMAARLTGVSPLVRVTCPDMIEIRKAFEMGAEGVIVPHVRTKEEMEICVRGAKFPPKGRRGYDGTVRSAAYGGAGFNASEYIEHSNDTELVIPMAEDFEFMDSIDELMSVPGIDAINFGPADFALSKNIRVFYDVNQPEVQEAMSEIAKYTIKMNIGLMAPAIPPTKESVDTLLSRGVNMIIMGSDMFNFQNALKNIRNNVIENYR
ncbi:MAG: 2,4-dihydroxyhept-2-ene-1,7-dioic acid aldolase [Clostridiales bacterium GWC2_40_7]|nr:MAG: 2,4-dihydroxyhept-2-ene-1,7-dioic acid aldolase [Clostridiales bacterium GWC2_40_7]